MKSREFTDVQDRVEQEGFDYCFIDYSDFEQIEDEKFHELRKAYVKAHDELKDYLGID